MPLSSSTRCLDGDRRPHAIGRACVFIQIQERDRRSIRVRGRRHDANCVPSLSVACDYDDGAKPGRQHLLALRQLRGDLERLSTEGGAQPTPAPTVTACDLTCESFESRPSNPHSIDQPGRSAICAMARSRAACCNTSALLRTGSRYLNRSDAYTRNSLAKVVLQSSQRNAPSRHMTDSRASWFSCA